MWMRHRFSFYASWFLCLFLCMNAVYADKPQRIVSLDLCTDWMLGKYAERKNVVALSRYVIQYPVDWIGSDWPTHNGSLEQLLALEPDLVLVGEYNALLLRQRLKDLGFKVEVLPLPKTLQDVSTYEKQLLTLIGEPLEKASVMPTPVFKENKAKLLLLGANGVGTGKGTFEDGVIAYAGWENYLTQEGYIRLDLEQLVVDPPGAIMWSAPKSKALANQFSEHKVLKALLGKDRWLSTDYWHWQCPGPWTWELVEKLKS